MNENPKDPPPPRDRPPSLWFQKLFLRGLRAIRDERGIPLTDEEYAKLESSLKEPE